MKKCMTLPRNLIPSILLDRITYFKPQVIPEEGYGGYINVDEKNVLSLNDKVISLSNLKGSGSLIDYKSKGTLLNVCGRLILLSLYNKKDLFQKEKVITIFKSIHNNMEAIDKLAYPVMEDLHFSLNGKNKVNKPYKPFVEEIDDFDVGCIENKSFVSKFITALYYCGVGFILSVLNEEDVENFIDKKEDFKSISIGKFLNTLTNSKNVNIDSIRSFINISYVFTKFSNYVTKTTGVVFDDYLSKIFFKISKYASENTEVSEDIMETIKKYYDNNKNGSVISDNELFDIVDRLTHEDSRVFMGYNIYENRQKFKSDLMRMDASYEPLLNKINTSSNGKALIDRYKDEINIPLYISLVKNMVNSKNILVKHIATQDIQDRYRYINAFVDYIHLSVAVTEINRFWKNNKGPFKIYGMNKVVPNEDGSFKIVDLKEIPYSEAIELAMREISCINERVVEEYAYTSIKEINKGNASQIKEVLNNNKIIDNFSASPFETLEDATLAYKNFRYPLFACLNEFEDKEIVKFINKIQNEGIVMDLTFLSKDKIKVTNVPKLMKNYDVRLIYDNTFIINNTYEKFININKDEFFSISSFL